MRLKKIKLAGFKSFVDATTIPFPGQMTAVLGPNGCGKSNVIDAVRWVLGESSAKNLRGDSMTDVIFNGSSARKPVSQCSVELVFDNASGRISGEYASYNELSVKRIVTKDATSTYHLNGAKCRRRDVTDLFLGTGLGPRSYAIIEQGMISKLIESKPQELRVFVEEAAGISKYKDRRRETENRIKHTKENLERLDDVRAELGQQLSKLQRQASAANKYTELKSEERSLKAELTALRWLKQSDLQAVSEANIAEYQLQLDEVLSKRTHDETQLLKWREQQADLKQLITDQQHSIFQLSTEITKIEQSQLFTTKRKQQIQSELSTLNVNEQELQTESELVAAQLQDIEEQMLALSPEKFILEESIEQAEFLSLEASGRLDDFYLEQRNAEQALLTVKQSMQTCYSQIDATTHLQNLTQSRLTDIEQFLSELLDQNYSHEIKLIQQTLLELRESTDTCQLVHQQVHNELECVERDFGKLEQESGQANQAVLKLEAKISALSAINEAQAHKDVKLEDLDTVNLSSYLRVKKGKEALVQKVMSTLPNAFVVKNADYKDLAHNFWHQQIGGFCYLENRFTDSKPDNSFAACFENSRLPHAFSNIIIVNSLEEGLLVLAQSSSEKDIYESVLLETGEWLFHDRLMNGELPNDGSFIRLAEIQTLQTEYDNRILEYKELTKRKEKTESERLKLKELKALKANDLSEYARQKFEYELKLDQLVEKQGSTAQQKTKYEHEREELTLSLALEQEKLAHLSDTTESLANEQIELESKCHDNTIKHEQLKHKLEELRMQLQVLTAQKHQLDMSEQQIKNTHLNLSEKQARYHETILDNEEKRQLLVEEAEELEMPQEQQEQRLSQLFEDKQKHIDEQKLSSEALKEVEENLLLLEKGQAGVNEKAEGIKSKIDSENLAVEACKVRAQHFLQQLSEMQQSLKQLLPSLDKDIDEVAWQDRLNKTQAALSRLGAVNLAAVQEFEQQSQRKQHLDLQNDDLRSALETLESAIRKIDRETKQRFKTTFDQVNEDLKMLFPKVFGGGSAYLDLTDENLLETGVTIMARPPGKKNSTIHLLSGGEKALTALSLVFAIFRLNPAPFCLLDEVDAPLDDANVGRFCKLVSEMSKTVQFIYITHNKVAMEMATHLTGVTMSEPGVSRMVAVDVEEALAIAE